jgi:site-specific DNA recombinase
VKQAGALIRVSTERQLEGTSPEKQLEKIHEFAEKQGFAISIENTWKIAESGAKKDRLGFAEALNAVQGGCISRLYVYSIDRLGRNLTDLLFFLRQMEDLEIEVWSAEKGELLQENNFFVQIMGAVSSLERQQIQKRTQDGLHRAIKEGKYSGGIVAYGYYLNPKTKQLEIHEKEAEVVRNIFNWCVNERLSCPRIAQRLNGLQIPTHYTKDGREIQYQGKRAPEKTAGIWRPGRVRNMLKNTAYYGNWAWGKRSKKKKQTIIPGYSPAIISEETYKQAQKVLKSNSLIQSDKPNHKYLLRGVIRCGICGNAYCGSTSMVGHNHSQEKSYYRCTGRTQWKHIGAKKCPADSLIADDIEEIVWSDVQAYIKNPDIIIQQLENQMKPIDKSLPAEIEKVKQQISEIDRKETNLIRLVAESHEINLEKVEDLLREYREQKQSLYEYLNQLVSENEFTENIENDRQDFGNRLKGMIARIDQASWEEKRIAICELVDQIIVTTREFDGQTIQEVEITYKFEGLFTRSSVPAFIMGCTGTDSWPLSAGSWRGRSASPGPG